MSMGLERHNRCGECTATHVGVSKAVCARPPLGRVGPNGQDTLVCGEPPSDALGIRSLFGLEPRPHDLFDLPRMLRHVVSIASASDEAGLCCAKTRWLDIR